MPTGNTTWNSNNPVRNQLVIIVIVKRLSWQGVVLRWNSLLRSAWHIMYSIIYIVICTLYSLTYDEGEDIVWVYVSCIYLIVYGKGVKAIGEDLHVTTEKAQEIKDSVLKAFPDLKEYLDNVVVFCKEHNYVEDFFGSRRRLPDINLPEYEFEFEDKTLDKRTIDYYTNLYTGKLNKAFGQNDKQEIIRIAKSYGIIIKQNGGFIAQAVRNAYNSPVQCTAAHLTKISMYRVARNKRLMEMGAYLELSIHDWLKRFCRG